MKNILILVFTLATIHCSFAQDRVELLDSLFNTMNKQEQFSGSVLVVFKGDVIYNKSFGYTDRETKTEITTNSLFNIGSVSKTITAVAILILSDEGKLNVDGSVSEYLPDFPYPKITIGHLMTHASGLPEINQLIAEWDGKKLITNKNILKILYDQKPELTFVPGSNSVFNDVGFIVLAEIVEKLSGQDFDTYCRQHIFLPSGMVRTGIYDAIKIKQVDDAAKGYFYSPFTQTYEEAVLSPDAGKRYALSGTKGDGNVWSTTEDLLKFCMAIAEASVTKEDLVTSMFLKKTEAKMTNDSKSYGRYFSYGWTIPDAPFRIAQARGDIPGFDAQIVWNLSENRMMIYLSNDYLSFTSYNTLVPYAVGTIVNQGVLNIPRKYASIDLTNEVLHISNSQIKDKLDAMKRDTITYDFDVPGLNYLIARLKDRGEENKAKVIESYIANQ